MQNAQPLIVIACPHCHVGNCTRAGFCGNCHARLFPPVEPLAHGPQSIPALAQGVQVPNLGVALPGSEGLHSAADLFARLSGYSLGAPLLTLLPQAQSPWGLAGTFLGALLPAGVATLCFMAASTQLRREARHGTQGATLLVGVAWGALGLGVWAYFLLKLFQLPGS